jgi:hypothetical protein
VFHDDVLQIIDSLRKFSRFDFDLKVAEKIEYIKTIVSLKIIKSNEIHFDIKKTFKAPLEAVSEIKKATFVEGSLK